MIITIDTNAPITLGPTTTDADYMRFLVYATVSSFQAQHGGTRDQAIATAKDLAVPAADGVPGVRVRIRAEALRRKRDGGFLPSAPVGNTKWLPSSPETVASLAAFAAASSALPAGLDIKSMDGTSYGLSKARVAVALDAYAAQMAAIDAAETAALAAQQANPSSFDFEAIAWPAVYVARP